MPSLIFRRTRPTVSRARRGFTLVEVMVALTLFGLVVGAILVAITGQQRFASGASAVMEMRDNLRQAADILPMELRGLAPKEAGELTAMLDSAIEFRGTAGTGVVCAINAARTAFVVPPRTLGSSAGLTAWAATPSSGDSLFILDPRGTLTDTLRAFAITATPATASCPTSTGFTATAAEAATGVQFTVSPAISATILVGSPVRFWHRVRYSLYKSATDNKWYMGYRDFNAVRVPQWSSIQPVSGPFLAHAANSAGGIAFTYRDSVGNSIALANVARLRRITVVARTQTSIKIRASGLASAQGYQKDSVLFGVALRNACPATTSC